MAEKTFRYLFLYYSAKFVGLVFGIFGGLLALVNLLGIFVPWVADEASAKQGLFLSFIAVALPLFFSILGWKMFRAKSFYED